MPGLQSVLVNAAVIVLAPIAGVASFLVGGLFAPHFDYSDPALSPTLRDGIEGFNLVSVACLAGVGWLGGRYSIVPALALGPLTLLLLPVLSLIEMRMYPTTHNLWPFEWMIYGVYTLLPMVGAGVGRWMQLNERDPP